MFIAGLLRVCFIGAAIFLALVRPVGAITVSSELSATALRATDTLVLRVVARWDGGEELVHFATPRPVDNPHLQLAGQSVGGESRLEEGEFVSEKTWHFSFVCVLPGSTQVVPPIIVYTNTQTEVTDSVIGSAMMLSIGPAPEPPFDYGKLWPYLMGLIVISLVAFSGVRLLLHRREAARQRESHQTPEEKAAELLDTLRPLKREDRCEQFYTDLEKIILGLWEARMDQRLVGKTPPEVADILRNGGVGDEIIQSVREVLTDCHTVRFGGGRVTLQTMDASFGAVEAWVKPSDRS